MIRRNISGRFTKENQWEKVRQFLNLDIEGQLYDLQKDIRERYNLWKKNPEIVRKMLSDLEQIIRTGRTRSLSE